MPSFFLSVTLIIIVGFIVFSSFKNRDSLDGEINASNRP